MGLGSKAGSFFANRSIGTKIGLGFVVVLAIFAASSVTAWMAFRTVSGSIDQFAGLMSRSGMYRDIDRSVAQYRGRVREYLFSHNEATAAAAKTDGAATRALIDTALGRAVDPRRRQMLAEISNWPTPTLRVSTSWRLSGTKPRSWNLRCWTSSAPS
jgi:hypothetical protein